MPAAIIDGKAVSGQIREELKQRVARLPGKPGLAVVIVGDDPASISYVAGKEKACAELGLASFQRHLPADASEAELLALIAGFNSDPSVHGILVQLPLPKQIDESRVIAAIDPSKDVDGFTPVNVGRLVLGERCFLPCTPHGVLELLKRSGIPTSGARVAIVGRSHLVGKPLANLMIRKDINSTVTICHTGTVDLASELIRADIVIACAGKPGLVKGDMVKEGACVIDVGVNRIEDPGSKKGFRLVGDVEYEAAARRAAFITPVPGGVGPMTITMLLANTVESAEIAFGMVR